MPILEGREHCLYCGASIKYARTETGQLPYEPAQAARTPIRRKQVQRQAEPRWDLEGPAGTIHSRRKSTRLTDERWAALEHKRRINKSTAGCLITWTLCVALFFSCGFFSFLQSQAGQPGQTKTTSVTANAMTATVRAFPNPYPPSQGLLILNDPLSSSQDSSLWMDYGRDQTPENQGCLFVNQAYNVTKTQQSTTIKPCLATLSNLDNFAYEVTMATSQDSSAGGIVFRQFISGAFYYFYITPDGYYGLWLNTGDEGKLLKEGASSQIHKGIEGVNSLAVVTNNTTLSLFVNRIYLTSVINATYDQGKIGVAVGLPDNPAGAERSFTYAKVWQL